VLTNAHAVLDPSEKISKNIFVKLGDHFIRAHVIAIGNTDGDETELTEETEESPEAEETEGDEAPDGKRNDAEICATGLVTGDFDKVASGVYNALSAPSCALNQDVLTALEQAKSFSPSACAVSGSGSAVFALFESEELCRWAKKQYKGKFKTRVVHTVIPYQKKKINNPYYLGSVTTDD